MKKIGIKNFTFRIIERIDVTNKEDIKEHIIYWKLRAVLAKIYETRILDIPLSRKEIIDQIAEAKPFVDELTDEH